MFGAGREIRKNSRQSQTSANTSEMNRFSSAGERDPEQVRAMFGRSRGAMIWPIISLAVDSIFGGGGALPTSSGHGSRGACSISRLGAAILP
jgi:hypothetical protein